MTVLHLHRPTVLPRVSMSAANMLCRKYPNNTPMHKFIWGIISQYPKREIRLEELRTAIEAIKHKLDSHNNVLL